MHPGRYISFIEEDADGRKTPEGTRYKHNATPIQHNPHPPNNKHRLVSSLAMNSKETFSSHE